VSPPLARLRGAARTYGSGRTAIVALHQSDCEVPRGARIALSGPSGSGKSTLLHLIAGLDEPTVGEVDWPAIGSQDELRPRSVAVIFQGLSLLPALSVLENVALPLVLSGVEDEDARRRAADALEKLDLAELGERLPEEISAGQAQRAAVARALAGDPILIIADEPTGQLDHVNGAMVVDVLLAAAEHAGAALVVATHDPDVAKRLPERWQLRDGELIGAQVEEASWSH
jgi:ABC-type lipoprotein export system ATPase subunit